MKFGKAPRRSDYRTLRFRDYIMPGLAAPAASFSILDRIYKALGVSDPSVLFPMDGNDSLGDCTIAALAHAITIYRAMVGINTVMAADACISLYQTLTGGPDTGLAELDVLNYWRQNPVDGEQILAYVSVDPANHAHVQQAISIFGGVYLGFQVQANAISDFDSHTPWTPGKLTQDGHAVYASGYDAQMVTVLTWGNTQQGTWAWWDECVDECYAILPAEAADNQVFDPGFGMAKLRQDLEVVARG